MISRRNIRPFLAGLALAVPIGVGWSEYAAHRQRAQARAVVLEAMRANFDLWQDVAREAQGELAEPRAWTPRDSQIK